MAIHNPLASDRRMAMDFGTSSPSKMWRNETIAYASVTVIAPITAAEPTPNQFSGTDTICSNAGLLTKPKPMLANVMPT